MSGNGCSFKYVIIGDTAVGKSSLLSIFTDKIRSDKYEPTIGVDFEKKQLDLDGKSVEINIWDTSGHPRYRQIAVNYYKGVLGVIIVYDITNLESFQNLNSWLNEIKNESSNACKILVGNKNDLEKDRKVTFEQGKEFANQNGMKFFETSVKENNNVKEIFLTIAKEIIQLNTNTKTNEKKEKNED
jgi:small GTP-binding protein